MSDEVDNCSQDNDTEPSEEDPQVVTIPSMSEGDDDLDGAPAEILETPAATEAAGATKQDVQSEGERAEETESGTTDEVIDLEEGEETPTAQASFTAAGAGERHIPGSSPARVQPHSPSRQTTTTPKLQAEASADMEKSGTKRPASMASWQDEDAHPAPQSNSTASQREGPSGEGRYPCGRTSASSVDYGTDNSATGEVKRRNRWSQGLLVWLLKEWTRQARPPAVHPARPIMESRTLLRHLSHRESHSQGRKVPWRLNPKQPNRPRNNGSMPLSKDC